MVLIRFTHWILPFVQAGVWKSPIYNFPHMQNPTLTPGHESHAIAWREYTLKWNWWKIFGLGRIYSDADIDEADWEYAQVQIDMTKTWQRRMCFCGVVYWCGVVCCRKSTYWSNLTLLTIRSVWLFLIKVFVKCKKIK